VAEDADDRRSPMSHYSEIEKLSAGSVFKLVFIGVTFAIIPFCLLAGVLALFGADTVRLDGAVQTGISGFIVSLSLAPFVGLLFAVFAIALIPLGWWIYGRLFRRRLLAQLAGGPDRH